MPHGIKPNQEFLKFISRQDNKNEFSNLNLLLELEKDYPGIFSRAMSNFDSVKEYRKSIDEKGRPIRVSWEEALKKCYFNTKYVGITKENVDIAELFAKKGLSQKLFDRASELRQQAKSANVPEHILGKPLKEETILKGIERIKSQTEEELSSGKEKIEELYDKQFTYEWLSKNDPYNNIIGIFCSCCATIEDNFYGGDIVKSSIIAPDVQTLVVRNAKGDIIAKGTMYVNTNKGYGVINDFELNDKYKHHETFPGIYNVKETSPEEQEREKIFQAFQRGIGAFVDEYDTQNPSAPLTQINIGMGYNRLKKQVERFEKATSKLAVPMEYDFQDAIVNQQYILYQREEIEKKKEGYDR